MDGIPTGTIRTVTCTICQESPNDALRLPCFHIFCRRCLSSLVRSYPPGQRNRLSCPNCRNETDLPRDGVDAFPQALIRSTRPRNQQSSKYIPCPQHRNNHLNLFCRECEEVICKECRKERHLRHNTDQLFRVIDQRKKEIENALQYEISTNTVQLQTDLSTASKHVEETQMNMSKDISDLKRQAMRIKNRIDTIVNDMSQKLGRGYDLQQEDAGYRLQLVQSRINGSQQFIDEAFHILSENDNDTILLNYRDLMALKHDVRSQQPQAQALTNRRLFSQGVGAKDQEIMRMLGKINPVASDGNESLGFRPVSRGDSTMSILSRYSVLPSIEPNSD